MAEEKKSAILIVDDEESVRKSIKDFLEERISCEIYEAETGSGATELVKRKRIDLLILDIKMPGISGIDVIKKAKELVPDLAVIIMTKWDSTHVIDAAMKAGAVDYIPKPISMKVFGPKIKELLNKKGRYFPLA